MLKALNVSLHHIYKCTLTLSPNGVKRKWQPTPVFLPGKIHGGACGLQPMGPLTEHMCVRVGGHGWVAINW